MKGRMMVMTTNHVDKLDPALIRPGRVDLSLEFKRCKKKDIEDIFEHFFSDENQLDMDNVNDDVWTPAEVAQICINHRDNIELAMEKIYEGPTVQVNKVPWIPSIGIIRDGPALAPSVVCSSSLMIEGGFCNNELEHIGDDPNPGYPGHLAN